MTPRSRSCAAGALLVPCVVAMVLAGQLIATGGGGPVRAALVARTAPSAAPASLPAPAAAPLALAHPGVPEPTPPPAPTTGRAAAAVAAAEGAAAATTDLAVAVLDRVTGEIALGTRGAEPFYTASLSKVVVAVDVLDRRRLEGLVVSEADVDLLRRALGPSDDAAMNALWSRFDGQGAAARVSQRLGLTGTTAPSDPSQWGEMSVPAADMLRIWDYVLGTLSIESRPDRDLIISAMEAAPVTARDGFDQAFGLLDPEVRAAESPVAAKQGWMCCFSGEYYLHSAGAVGEDSRFVVALLTRIPRDWGWEAARRQLDRIAVDAVRPLY